MDFGGETPELVLINLVVSDGDPSRGQRESLLSTDLKKLVLQQVNMTLIDIALLLFLAQNLLIKLTQMILAL